MQTRPKIRNLRSGISVYGLYRACSSTRKLDTRRGNCVQRLQAVNNLKTLLLVCGSCIQYVGAVLKVWTLYTAKGSCIQRVEAV